MVTHHSCDITLHKFMGLKFWQAEVKQWFLLWTFCYIVVVIIVNCATVFPNATCPSMERFGLMWSSAWVSWEIPCRGTHAERRKPAAVPSASATPATTPGQGREPVLEVTRATEAYADLWKIKCQGSSKIRNIDTISLTVIWAIVKIFWRKGALLQDVRKLLDPSTWS